MMHSMFMSKPASFVEPEERFPDEDPGYEEFPNGEFPVPGVNYFPHLYAADCYGG